MAYIEDLWEEYKLFVRDAPFMVSLLVTAFGSVICGLIIILGVCFIAMTYTLLKSMPWLLIAIAGVAMVPVIIVLIAKHCAKRDARE